MASATDKQIRGCQKPAIPAINGSDIPQISCSGMSPVLHECCAHDSLLFYFTFPASYTTCLMHYLLNALST